MRLLLDTHAFVWWVRASPSLSFSASSAISNEATSVSVSVVSAWEIAIKVGRGKWPEAQNLLDEFERAVTDEGFSLLSISVPHVRAAGLMRSPHRDPFDRLLAAQATSEGLTLVTTDPLVQQLGASWLW